MAVTHVRLISKTLRVTTLAGMLVAAGTVAIAQPPTRTPPRQAKPRTPTITLTTAPSPAVMGATTFTVTVEAPDGKPVTGADVTVELVMPAMPSMNMAEMRNKTTLDPSPDPKRAATGTYTGRGQIMMAGKWNAVVSVKVDGEDYAEKKLTITAK